MLMSAVSVKPNVV